MKIKVNGQDVWVSAEEAIAPDGSVHYLGYWSLRRPGAILGQSVKDGRGNPKLYGSDVEAASAAEEAAKAHLGAGWNVGEQGFMTDSSAPTGVVEATVVDTEDDGTRLQVEWETAGKVQKATVNSSAVYHTVDELILHNAVFWTAFNLALQANAAPRDVWDEAVRKVQEDLDD